MSLLIRIARWLLTRLTAAVVLFAAAERAWAAWRRRSVTEAQRRTSARKVLPSLFDLHPGATKAPRRPVGVRTVPLERIVGTTRHPSQNTADFLPLPRLRGQNWRGRWQRITRAVDRLAVLPPIDLLQVGNEYWVEDGHNRVAAARHAGALEIDAAVTQLLLPDLPPTERGWTDASSLAGSEELRQAARGHHSRTVEQRMEVDELSRDALIGHEDGPG